ncbi:MAG TPA: response regulator [Burkholderiales bacterium]|nr:response regulator [Burkholderiales bacterium]
MRPLERVCYVEDDEHAQFIVGVSLEKLGRMIVEVVSDPDAAIEAITRFNPDLVMQDWMMPGMDGPALFRKIKQQPQLAALPIVFITATTMPKELDELIALGAAATISKPFSPTNLPDQLRAIWCDLP